MSTVSPLAMLACRSSATVPSTIPDHRSLAGGSVPHRSAATQPYTRVAAQPERPDHEAEMTTIHTPTSLTATSRPRLARRVRDVPPSGIRRFFDVINTMPDVISLGVGEPDFDTPAVI